MGIFPRVSSNISLKSQECFRGDGVRTTTIPAEFDGSVVAVETKADGKTTRTDTPKDYQATLVNRVVPTLEVKIPKLYVIPPGFPKAVETLQRHGIQLEELTEDLMLEAEQFVVSEVTKAPRAFQQHNLVKLEGKTEKNPIMVRAGSVIVKVAQPLGSLAAYLLEPQCEDGLATWNVFDAALQPGKPYPVLRLLTAPLMQTVSVAALQDDKPAAKKPITLEAMQTGRVSQGGGGGRRGSAGSADVGWRHAVGWLRTDPLPAVALELRIVFPPAQNDVLPLMVVVGSAFTVITWLLILLHPEAFIKE